MSNTSNRWKKIGGINRTSEHNIVRTQTAVNNSLNITRAIGTSNLDTNLYGNLNIYGHLDISDDLDISGTITTNSDAYINGITVGLGNGDISSNTAIGYDALYSNINGSYNTAIGYDALYSNINGSYNTAIGYDALHYNTDGSYNTAIGFGALQFNINGVSNAAVGEYALGNTNGNYNTAIGQRAGQVNETGCCNTYLGYQANTTNANFSYSTAVGWFATITASNQLVLGNDATTTVDFQNIPATTVYIPGTLDVSGTITCPTGNNSALAVSVYLPNNVNIVRQNLVDVSFNSIAQTPSGSQTIIQCRYTLNVVGSSGIIVAYASGNFSFSAFRLANGYGLPINQPINDPAVTIPGYTGITAWNTAVGATNAVYNPLAYLYFEWSNVSPLFFTLYTIKDPAVLSQNTQATFNLEILNCGGSVVNLPAPAPIDWTTTITPNVSTIEQP
jgi:hypothetical protein